MSSDNRTPRRKAAAPKKSSYARRLRRCRASSDPGGTVWVGLKTIPLLFACSEVLGRYKRELLGRIDP